ncbi:hypothetical protein BGZ65_010147 [Modicella reniformis]|uniref:Uncharacterized protein n=1 Tax=Modicella reniformis TaxID=1440133 RepID=A0A9P6LRJ5_9FUNG|nr:hypothetical protein BGZ65_010147 [Modicella reniformis]
MNSFRGHLLNEVKKRLRTTNDYLLATALHPTFNTLWFLDDETRSNLIKSHLRDEYNDIAPKVYLWPESGNESVTLQDEQPEGSSVLHNLLKRLRQQCGSNLLSESLANEELSAISKWISRAIWWTLTRNIVTDKRSRLNDDAVSDIVFCNYATKCLKMADKMKVGTSALLKDHAEFAEEKKLENQSSVSFFYSQNAIEKKYKDFPVAGFALASICQIVAVHGNPSNALSEQT